MTQFLDYNKDNFDLNSRSRSDGNFLQNALIPHPKAQSINSDERVKKRIPKNYINKNMTPKSQDIRLEN
jgi:hypothetical protein